MQEDKCLNTENNDKVPHQLPIQNDISKQEFHNYFLKSNKPGLINIDIADWLSTKYWIKSNKPNFEYLHNYGNSIVKVYKCDEKEFNSQVSYEMKFENYLVYWKDYIDNMYSTDIRVFYLKDWHLKSETKNDFYEVPTYFSSDWLNEYLTANNKEDYRFVYMGPKNSWTPFHKDVFSSYSWSINIIGTKKWILFPPNEEKKLLKLNKLPYNIEEIPSDVEYYEVIQQPGNAIFVPSGWYHQVWNLEDTISINHNWINCYNIKIVWDSLNECLIDVKQEMEQWETETTCSQNQVILKNMFGMDFKDFFDFIKYITLKRLEQLNQNKDNEEEMLVLDLDAAQNVLKMFVDHADLNDSDLATLKSDILQLLEELSTKFVKL